MKKLNYTATQNFPCSCSSHILLLVGERCETCMGIVMESAGDLVSQMEQDSRYDVDYFEALDQWFERMEFAA